MEVPRTQSKQSTYSSITDTMKIEGVEGEEGAVAMPIEIDVASVGENDNDDISCTVPLSAKNGKAFNTSKDARANKKLTFLQVQ